jgi:hypothetical protein
LKGLVLVQQLLNLDQTEKSSKKLNKLSNEQQNCLESSQKTRQCPGGQYNTAEGVMVV